MLLKKTKVTIFMSDVFPRFDLKLVISDYEISVTTNYREVLVVFKIFRYNFDFPKLHQYHSPFGFFKIQYRIHNQKSGNFFFENVAFAPYFD